MLEMDKDKRNFKRYIRQAECILKTNTGIFKGELIDYSEGIGVLINGDSPSLVPGNLVDINVRTPNIEIKGEVVWAKRVASGIRIGIGRADEFRGYLSDFRLADILIALQKSAKTGVLEMKSGSILKRIYIKKGDVIFAESNQEDDRLGDVLLKAGKISLEQYNQTGEIFKLTGDRQGKILVELGYLKPKDLPLSVRHQVETIILSLFTIMDGEFNFKETPLPTKETITLKLSVANLIYRGIKMINNFQYIRFQYKYIREVCPPLEAVLCLSPDPLNLFQDISIVDADKKILSYINGKNTLKDILSLFTLNDFETLKTIHALLSTRIIRVKGEDQLPPELTPEEVVAESEREPEKEFTKKIEDIYKKYKELGYYGFLGVDEFSSDEEIKKAYYKSAKEYHPDLHFLLPSEDIKEKLHTILSYLTEAYMTLSDPEKRKEYDRSLSYKPSKIAEEAKGESIFSKQELGIETIKDNKDIYLEETKHSELLERRDVNFTDKESIITEDRLIDEKKTVNEDKYKETVHEIEKEDKVTQLHGQTQQSEGNENIIRILGKTFVPETQSGEKKRRSLLFIPIIIIVLILFVVILYVVPPKIRKGTQPQLTVTKEETAQQLQLPQFREELLKGMLKEENKQQLQLPPFSEDHFKRMLKEENKQQLQLPPFREEFFKKLLKEE